jgi:hypothetical protein
LNFANKLDSGEGLTNKDLQLFRSSAISAGKIASRVIDQEANSRIDTAGDLDISPDAMRRVMNTRLDRMKGSTEKSINTPPPKWLNEPEGTAIDRAATQASQGQKIKDKFSSATEKVVGAAGSAASGIVDGAINAIKSGAKSKQAIPDSKESAKEEAERLRKELGQGG